MTTPVNFSIAKLLKEKGFDEYTKIWHQRGDGVVGCVEGKRDFYNRKGDVYTSAPTISEVVMWLYEKHGIWIDVSLNQFSKPKDLQWMYSIVFTEDCTYSHSPKSYISPTEAYEAAIEYVLTKLIKDVQTNQ